MSPRVLASVEMKQHEACSRVGRGNVLDHGFAAVETAHDPLALWDRIKSMCRGFEAHKMKFYALSQAIKKLMMFYHKPGMHNEEYKRQFETLWDTVVQFRESVTNHTDLIAARATKMLQQTIKMRHIKLIGTRQQLRWTSK